MKKALFAAAIVAMQPLAALALPAVGDVVGTNSKDAAAALAAKGCKVSGFEAEDGKVEAKCVDTTTEKKWEIYISPKTGAVVELKSRD